MSINELKNIEEEIKIANSEELNKRAYVDGVSVV